MTKVYFVQHGIALSKEADPERPLSEAGRVEVERVAAHLARHGIVVRAIRHSGKLRARQTAELLADHLEVAEVTAVPAMNPNDDAWELLKRLETDGEMFVGHLPHLQHVVSRLAGGSGSHPVVRFRNAGVVCMEVAGGTGTIQWAITPDLI